MGIITQSKSFSVAAGTSSPASPPTKYNNTESHSQAKLRLTTSRSNVAYPGSGFAYFPLGFAHNGDQRRSKRDQDRTRRACTNALFTLPLTRPQTPEKSKILSKNNEKKRYTFSKAHHDSPIEGTKISNLHRPIELDELYRMDSFLLKFHACISAKYLQNPGFSRKLPHDSPSDGTKTSNLYRSVELDELYRMDSFLLKFHACISPKTAKYLQK